MKTLLVCLIALYITLPSYGADRGIKSYERRIALVIGNSRYSAEEGPLKNPVNDVRTMAKVLKRTGFKVTKLENVPYNKMRETIWGFGQQLRKADVALFYFSGHGVQFEGNNYLLPLNTMISTPRHIQLQAVS